MAKNEQRRARWWPAPRPSASSWRRTCSSPASAPGCARARRRSITWMMERTMSKRRILELYLNVAEWGEGVFGAEAAARYHFGVRRRRARGPSRRRGSPRSCPARGATRAAASRPMSQAASTTILARMHGAQIPVTHAAEAAHSRLEVEDLQQNLQRGAGAAARRRARAGRAARRSSTALHPADIAYILEALPPRASASRSGTWSRPIATARSCSRSRTRCASRSSRRMDSQRAGRRGRDARGRRDRRPRAATCRRRSSRTWSSALPVEEREQLRAALSYRRGHGRRADGFRPRHACATTSTLEAATRYLRAPGRAAGAHRPAVRRRPRASVLQGTLPLARLIVIGPRARRWRA